MTDEVKRHTAAQLQARIGQEVGVSDWLLIDQSMIDRFADLTGDHQFIHVDPQKAAETPFGGTIAHGFLVLSVLPRLARHAEYRLQDVRMGVNYGFDKLRMMAPVRSGARVRGRFVLNKLVERQPGQWLTSVGVTVEVEGSDKPAIAAEWLTLQVLA